MNWYLMVWNKYAQFSGRSRRKEYWMFTLFNCLIYLPLYILGLVFHENVVGAGNETAHATQFFEGVAGQLGGILSLYDGHLGQCRIGRDGVTALEIHCQGGFGPKAVLAEPESQAGSARGNSAETEQLDERVATT